MISEKLRQSGLMGLVYIYIIYILSGTLIKISSRMFPAVCVGSPIIWCGLGQIQNHNRFMIEGIDHTGNPS